MNAFRRAEKTVSGHYGLLATGGDEDQIAASEEACLEAIQNVWNRFDSHRRDQKKKIKNPFSDCEQNKLKPQFTCSYLSKLKNLRAIVHHPNQNFAEIETPCGIMIQLENTSAHAVATGTGWISADFTCVESHQELERLPPLREFFAHAMKIYEVAINDAKSCND